MIFSLEALQADKGDSLILHYGAERPHFMLVDGGPGGVFRDRLGPRLEALRGRWFPEGELPIELLLVSHMDDDHIRGILDLLGSLVSKADDLQPLPFRVKTVWHNGFEGLLGDDLRRLSGALQASLARISADLAARAEAASADFSRALTASFSQSERLLADLRRLAVPLNQGFTGLVSREGARRPSSWGEGLALTVLSPSRARLKDLFTKWRRWLEDKARKRENLSALLAALTDRSVYNLSSIVVLAELGGKLMLLTGDARGDDIIEGLERRKRLADGTVHLDLLKVPHHGSDKNVSPEFFQRVTADHYVISGNGEEGNPETKTLEMLTAARGNDRYTLHFTNGGGAGDLGRRLRDFFGRPEERGRSYTVRFREENEPSLKVDLLDPVRY